ncbi:MAG: hypothetical protein V1866_04845 [archaeon]
MSILILVIVLAGCSKKECSVSSDCAQTACFTGKCSDGICQKIAKPNCCGNAKCDAGVGENSCTCSDCGNCTKKGKVKYNLTSSRGPKPMEAKYAQYMCDESHTCVIGADPAIVNQLRLTQKLDERGYFQAEILNILNQPFTTRSDKINIRIRLTDFNQVVKSPITFTGIQVLSGSSLLGEKRISDVLANVGDEFVEELSIISSQSLVEQEMSLEIKLDYEFTVTERGADVLKRLTKKNALSEKITLIVPE